MSITFGVPHTVQGWPADDIVTTVAIDDKRERVEGYTHVVRRNTDASPVILVPTVALTPVDTTPPEPEPGAWLIGEHVAVRFAVDETWAIAGDPDLEWEHVWQMCGGSGITPRRLVPEPAPVELPWAKRVSHQVALRVTDDRFLDDVTGRVDGAVYLEAVWGDGEKVIAPVMTVDDAEEMAAALLAAARAAREASHG